MIRGTILGWIKDFLSNKMQKVLVNGEKSNSADVLSSVLQGTVLAPLLYAIPMIYLILLNIKSEYMLTILCYTTQYTTLMIVFNFKLSDISKWAKAWQMDFDPSKCEFLKLTNKKLPSHFNYHINNELIKEVQHVQYLGVTYY